MIIKSLHNKNARSGKLMQGVKAIVIHNVGKDNQRAKDVIDWWDSTGNKGGASAHYVIDIDGEVYEAIPVSERANHVGSSTPDPVSGSIYTDLARIKFGKYASDPIGLSPNPVAVGIEMCHKDGGVFTEETIQAAIKLCCVLLKRYRLDETDVLTHYEVVGWKACPTLWTAKPSLLEAFKNDVRSLMCYTV